MSRLVRSLIRRRLPWWVWLTSSTTLLTVAGAVVFIILVAAVFSRMEARLPGFNAAGIPPVVFASYVQASHAAPTFHPECRVRPAILAGIGWQESRHGTMGGAFAQPNGDVHPPIIGPPLDGTQGRLAIRDTDGGVWDGDEVWDRAVGPKQFIPSSWRRFAQDGNGDGTADPHNTYDASLATVAHLCGTTPADLDTSEEALRAALFAYNRSTAYVETVVERIGHYDPLLTQSLIAGITVGETYVFPLPRSLVTVTQIRRTHHDYPASDLTVPEGTPVYAATGGQVASISAPCADVMVCRCGWGVTITGDDGLTYGYCHGHTRPPVSRGDRVMAGQFIMFSGDTGNSTTPHLHFQIRHPSRGLLCPQGPLEAWWYLIPVNPATAPTSGCNH